MISIILPFVSCPTKSHKVIQILVVHDIQLIVTNKDQILSNNLQIALTDFLGMCGLTGLASA